MKNFHVVSGLAIEHGIGTPDLLDFLWNPLRATVKQPRCHGNKDAILISIKNQHAGNRRFISDFMHSLRTHLKFAGS
jgi:hypothetical protein